jgi:von Willebrand factor A domain-containing protein 8
MACEELKCQLKELNMSASDAKGYGQLLNGVDTHIRSLHDLLERMFLVGCNCIL